MINISIKNTKQSYTESAVTGSAILGRKTSHQDARAIVLDDDYASRSHLWIESQGSNLLLKNVSKRLDVDVQDPQKLTLKPQTDLVLPLPVSVRLGRTSVEIKSASIADLQDSIGLTTIGAPVNTISRHPRAVVAPSASPTTDELIKWFETLIAVQVSAAGSNEFYLQTARAVVDLVQLDYGMVLLRSGESWNAVSQYSTDLNDHLEWSDFILSQVVGQRRTFFQLDKVNSTTESISNIESVVASPIFDTKSDQVIGAVYGARKVGNGTINDQISPLEAQLVQVLAAAVGSGLARQHEEAEATRRHVQFEQFVSPQVASELDRNPNLLEGQDTEVTVLFVDIRSFSTISERLDAKVLCELVRSIMERLANRVREHCGTTVSYLGDGLMAMWNAPVRQEDHTARACRAALAMLSDLPTIDEEWEGVVGGPLRVGIGINTGQAMVGNTGSRFKPQYGPLGDTVNLASRVEGVTKKLSVPILMTGASKNQIGNSFATRRLCRVRVVGKSEPVELYELHAEQATSEWEVWRDQFESALNQFESGHWKDACTTVFPLLSNDDGSNDGPSLCLISRSVECLNTVPEPFDPVWNLISK